MLSYSRRQLFQWPSLSSRSPNYDTMKRQSPWYQAGQPDKVLLIVHQIRLRTRDHRDVTSVEGTSIHGRDLQMEVRSGCVISVTLRTLVSFYPQSLEGIQLRLQSIRTTTAIYPPQGRGPIIKTVQNCYTALSTLRFLAITGPFRPRPPFSM
jgi:hypothetical protein